jgi:hypothetical protein
MSSIVEAITAPVRYAFVYKLWHADEPNEFYVGSTTTSLERRLKGHKSRFKEHSRQPTGRRLYQFLEAKDLTKLRIQEVERIAFQTAAQLRIREDHHIRALNPTLNSYMAVLDTENVKSYKKQWYEENKELTQQRSNDRYTNNKEQVLQKRRDYKEANRDRLLARRRELYALKRNAQNA